MESTRERKPDLVIVDTLTDKHGRTVKVGYRGSDVEVIVTPHSGHDGRMAFDGEGRDRFMRAFAESERRAEGGAAPVYLLGCGCQASDGTTAIPGQAWHCDEHGDTTAVMTIPLAAPGQAS